MTNDAPKISTLSVEDLARRTAELTALLAACVHDGASIGFVLPFGEQEAEAFWTRKVLPASATARACCWQPKRTAGSWAPCSSAMTRRPTSRTAPTSTS